MVPHRLYMVESHGRERERKTTAGCDAETAFEISIDHNPDLNMILISDQRPGEHDVDTVDRGAIGGGHAKPLHSWHSQHKIL